MWQQMVLMMAYTTGSIRRLPTTISAIRWRDQGQPPASVIRELTITTNAFGVARKTESGYRVQIAGRLLPLQRKGILHGSRRPSIQTVRMTTWYRLRTLS